MGISCNDEWRLEEEEEEEEVGFLGKRNFFLRGMFGINLWKI